MNRVVLVGRLCREPELRYVGENNTPVTDFILAINRNYKNSQDKYDADFINCELWNKRAETFCQYVTKGQLISVEGRLKVDKYVSSSGENKIKTIVRADNFYFVSSKSDNTNTQNTFNREDVFENEEGFECEILEDNIPF